MCEIYSKLINTPERDSCFTSIYVDTSIFVDTFHTSCIVLIEPLIGELGRDRRVEFGILSYKDFRTSHLIVYKGFMWIKN